MLKFHNPNEFPYEAFVERRVSEHFQNAGYEVSTEIAFLDLHFKSAGKGGEWRIECKGETSSIGVDFNTGIGQILKRMDDENSNYALALPETQKFRRQTKQIPPAVRKKLKLYWIWVNEKGDIKIENP